MRRGRVSLPGRLAACAVSAFLVGIAAPAGSGIPVISDPDETRYIGIGVRISPEPDEEGYIRVAEILPQARRDVSRALKVGDRLLEVDGRPVRGEDPDDVIRHIRGPAGTRLTLKLGRMGRDAPVEVTVRRREIVTFRPR